MANEREGEICTMTHQSHPSCDQHIFRQHGVQGPAMEVGKVGECHGGGGRGYWLTVVRGSGAVGGGGAVRGSRLLSLGSQVSGAN